MITSVLASRTVMEATTGRMIRGLFMSRSVGRSPAFAVASTLQPLRYKSTRPDMNQNTNTSSLNYNAISDWFVQLRWKAAHILTNSLTDSERQELLRRMNLPSTQPIVDTAKAKVDEDSEETSSRSHTLSIAEAVAAARAQESKLNEERWEREKEKLYRDAEIAARERVESDMLIQKRQIAFEQWKKNLAAESSAIEEADVVKEKQTPQVPQEVSVKLEQVEEMHPHPILGPCILDLGYKRMHVVTAQALAAIPVWEKQRIYRHDRAKTMAADKLKTLHLGMPGVIGLYECSDGKLSILDGQHRVGCFTILEGMKKEGKNAFLEKIVVEVYSKPHTSNEGDSTTSSELSAEQQDSTLAREIFLEINKAEPVKLVDIPGIVKGSDRKILNDAVDQLYDEYHEMFRTSTKCHPPHVNIDNIRDAIFAANVIARHKMKSPKQLHDWLLLQNTILSEKYKENENTDTRHYTTKALEKAIKHNFYLGLESGWYYN
jgi:hypothetical protein